MRYNCFPKLTSIASLAIIIIATSACTMPEWIGGSGATKKLEGDRITLLQTDKSITTDAAIANKLVQLPSPRRNTRWYKSNAQHILTEQNPRAPWKLKSFKTISVGEGSDDINYPLALQPVIADQKIFVMDAAGTVSAYPVENTTDTPLWITHIEVEEGKENFTQGGLVYDQGKLFVSSGYTAVIALDAQTGAELWKKSISGVTRSAPDARDGQLFVQTLDNRLYALSANDGTILWIHSEIEKELTRIGAASPVALGEAVLASYSSGGIYALKSDSGKGVWTDSLASTDSNSLYLLSDIDVTPVISDGRVYAASQGGALASFELFTGTRVWEREFPSSGGLWIASNFLYAMSEHAEVAAFYTVNGGVKWVSSLPRYQEQEEKEGYIHWSGPIMAGSRLLVVGSHGKMLAISPMSGEIMKEYDIPEDIYAAPVVAYGNIYLYSNDAVLSIYSGPEKIATKEDFINIPNVIPEGAENKDTSEGPVKKGLSSVGEFFQGILKRFKAEPEDEAQSDEKP